MSTARTAQGHYVSEVVGLCDQCARNLGARVVILTDDSLGFPEAPGERFAQIQRLATDSRAECLRVCGRA